MEKIKAENQQEKEGDLSAKINELKNKFGGK
jgi:hypothetical protein